MLNAFTVDVEDYFHVSAFESTIDRKTWSDYPGRIHESLPRLLDLLDAKQVRGTFFVLGWIADHYPQLVARIAGAGHELACHSYWHRLVPTLSPQTFRHDLRQARQAIEDASGQGVAAYRAPSFSITAKSLWALDVLLEEGFRIDSSVYPIRHDRYGIPRAPLAPHRVRRPRGGLWECPPATAEALGLRLPVGGGGYFRLYPFRITKALLQRIERKRPFVFYVHPWEIDPEQPRMPFAKGTVALRHYVNLQHTYGKLDQLLDTFAFGPLSAVLKATPLTSQQRALARSGG